MLKRLWNDESGQGMVEYGLIIGAVAVLLIIALGAFRGQIVNMFENIGGKLQPTATTAP